MVSVRCFTSCSRVRNAIARACWSAVFGSTNRIVGRRAASTMASASAASFFCRLIYHQVPIMHNAEERAQISLL